MGRRKPVQTTAGSTIPALLGVAEIADLFGVVPDTVTKWRWRDLFPAPDYRLAIGDIWKAETVIDFGRRTRRIT